MADVFPIFGRVLFAPAVAPLVSAPSIRVTCTALYDLTKPRLAAMSVLTAMAAYTLTDPTHGSAHAALTGLGTTLAAGGALSLNQWWERKTDAQMRRTRWATEIGSISGALPALLGSAAAGNVWSFTPSPACDGRSSRPRRSRR